MECKKVIEILEKQSPKSYACDWDNVGLLVGREDKEIQKIYIALDATDEAIEEAIANGADMLLTHHPMIFKGMKRVTQEDFIGRRIIRLIQNDMVYYAMHTNFDVMGMADLAADYLGISDTRVLEITSVSETGEEGIGRYGSLKKEMTVRECCEEVKQAFSLENVKVFGDLERKVKTAAISPGSGRSVISNALQAGVDVLITGDIDHHGNRCGGTETDGNRCRALRSGTYFYPIYGTVFKKRSKRTGDCSTATDISISDHIV